jgi:hypothetical protein
MDLPEVKAERPTPAIKRGAFHTNIAWESMTVVWGKEIVVALALSRVVCVVEETLCRFQGRCLTVSAEALWTSTNFAHKLDTQLND